MPTADPQKHEPNKWLFLKSLCPGWFVAQRHITGMYVDMQTLEAVTAKTLKFTGPDAASLVHS